MLRVSSKTHAFIYLNSDEYITNYAMLRYSYAIVKYTILRNGDECSPR